MEYEPIPCLSLTRTSGSALLVGLLTFVAILGPRPPEHGNFSVVHIVDKDVGRSERQRYRRPSRYVLVKRRIQKGLEITLGELQPAHGPMKFFLGFRLEGVGPQLTDSASAAERRVANLLAIVSGFQDLFDLLQLFQPLREVGKEVIDEAHGDAVFVDIPLVLDEARQYARRLDALQGPVLPVTGMRHKVSDSANRYPLCARNRHPLFLDAQVQAGAVADMLKVLEMADDLHIERLWSGSLRELLRHRGRLRELVPGGVFADRMQKPEHRIGFVVIGPTADGGPPFNSGKLVPETLAVGRPCVTQKLAGGAARTTSKSVLKPGHTSSSPFLAVISSPMRASQRSGGCDLSSFSHASSIWIWRSSSPEARTSCRSLSLRRILLASRWSMASPTLPPASTTTGR